MAFRSCVFLSRFRSCIFLSHLQNGSCYGTPLSGLEIQVYVSSIDLNLQPFKGNGDVSKCGTKNPNINTNNQPTVYMFFLRILRKVQTVRIGDTLNMLYRNNKDTYLIIS